MTSDDNSTRRDVLTRAGAGVLGIGGFAAYLRYGPSPPTFDIEITEGNEYLTDVTIEDNGESRVLPGDGGLKISVSGALDGDSVVFELRTNGDSVGWGAVRDPPGTANPGFQITTDALPGEYTVLLYGVPEFGERDEWDEEDGPSNRPPDAKARFTITKEPGGR